MKTIEPCDCGGLPYIAKMNDDYSDTDLSFVKCQKCGTASHFFHDEDDAVDDWNRSI